MGVEDFSVDYTKVDPAGNGDITVTSTRATATVLNRNEDAYLYRDKGVNHFDGDFEHLITGKATLMDVSCLVSIWGLYNVLDDHKGVEDASEDGLTVFFHNASASTRLYLKEIDAGTFYEVFSVINLDTDYYLRIVRDESIGTHGTVFCFIYTDAARTVLLDTSSIALHTSKKDFRYVYGMQSFNSSTTEEFSGYSENLDLQEVGVGVAELNELAKRSIMRPAIRSVTKDPWTDREV